MEAAASPRRRRYKTHQKGRNTYDDRFLHVCEASAVAKVGVWLSSPPPPLSLCIYMYMYRVNPNLCYFSSCGLFAPSFVGRRLV